MGYIPTKRWIKKLCIACKETFKVTPCRKNAAKYCSQKCYHKMNVIWNKGLKKNDPRVYSGERHHLWKGGVTKEDFYQRKLFHKQMQKLIFERDNYTCQLCGEMGDLQVDHIQSWAEYVELRFSMDNCRTLCKSCHYLITYGKPIPNMKMPWGHNLGKESDDL